MNAIVRPLQPVVIEPALLRTKLVTGVLHPAQTAGNWALTFYEERPAEDGSIDWLVVERLATTLPNMERIALLIAAACACNRRHHFATTDIGGR